MSFRRNGSVSRAAEISTKNRLHMDRNPQHTRINDPAHPAGRRKEIDNVMKRARQSSPGTWDRKLLEVEEKDPNRWRHTGYKQMYIDGSPRRSGSRSPIRRSRSPIGRRSPPPQARGPPRSAVGLGRRSPSPVRRARTPPHRRTPPPRSPRRRSPRPRSPPPPTRRISPPGRRISPPGRRVSPPGRRVSPPRGRVVSPPPRGRVVSPARGRPKPKPQPLRTRPPSPPDPRKSSPSGSSASSCSDESCSVCSAKNRKAAAPPPKPKPGASTASVPTKRSGPPASRAVQPTKELLRAREASKRSREEKVLEWQRTQLVVPPAAPIPPTHIKREGQRRPPPPQPPPGAKAPPPRRPERGVSPTAIAAALADSGSDSESGDSEPQPQRLTLSERFGKMAQWSLDRSARIENMKITRRDAGLHVHIERSERSTSPANESTEAAPIGSYPEELLASAPVGLPLWDDVKVRYDYYKKRGYLRGLTLSDYVKWEEWWYKYQDWLKRERAYERWAEGEGSVRRERRRRGGRHRRS